MHLEHKNTITQSKPKQQAQIWLPRMTSGLETEWVYSKEKVRKKISKEK